MAKKNSSTPLFEDSPTKGMYYDVCAISSHKNIKDTYPDLFETDAIKSYPPEDEDDPIDINLVIKYIVILYSADSVLNTKVQRKSLIDRKLIAANMTGFKTNNKNEFNKNVQTKLFQLKHPIVPTIIVDYLRSQNNYLWDEICKGEQLLWESALGIFTVANDDKDKDNIASLKNKKIILFEGIDIRKMVERSYREFFLDHDDVKNKAGVKIVRKTLAEMANKQYV